MSFEITNVTALEILDSRGRPTLQTTVTLADGTTAVAGVPSARVTVVCRVGRPRESRISRAVTFVISKLI